MEGPCGLGVRESTGTGEPLRGTAEKTSGIGERTGRGSDSVQIASGTREPQIGAAKDDPCATTIILINKDLSLYQMVMF